MRKIVWAISIIFTLSFVNLLYAQFGQTSGPSFHGEFKPVIGGWSEYQMTAKGNPPTKMKVAVV